MSHPPFSTATVGSDRFLAAAREAPVYVARAPRANRSEAVQSPCNGACLNGIRLGTERRPLKSSGGLRETLGGHARDRRERTSVGEELTPFPCKPYTRSEPGRPAGSLASEDLARENRGNLAASRHPWATLRLASPLRLGPRWGETVEVGNSKAC